MKIQKALPEQLDQLLPLYENARQFMAEHGNPTQWGSTRPGIDQLRCDIADGCLFLCMDDRQIAAVFCLRPGPDETYAHIENGSWLNDHPYGVVHRIISTGKVPGAATFCLNWALEQYGNLRIDTHRDNRPMRNLLQKLGFTPCGVIYVLDGTPRLAFQKTL